MHLTEMYILNLMAIFSRVTNKQSLPEMIRKALLYSDGYYNLLFQKITQN